MSFRGNRPAAERLQTRRLTLEPLRIEHADEMFPELADRNLHKYTGGEPLSREQLQARDARQIAGHSLDGAQGWLNWIAREHKTDAVIGTVQATLSCQQGHLAAQLAWIVAVGHVWESLNAT